MTDPSSPPASPPRSHEEWVQVARERLDNPDSINALFQAIHYDSGLTFAVSDQTDPDNIDDDKQSELVAAHLTAIAVATSTPVEDIAADAVKTSRELAEEGIWSGLDITYSSEGEPSLCLGCGRPSGEDAADTTFTQLTSGEWECNSCGATIDTPLDD